MIKFIKEKLIWILFGGGIVFAAGMGVPPEMPAAGGEEPIEPPIIYEEEYLDTKLTIIDEHEECADVCEMRKSPDKCDDVCSIVNGERICESICVPMPDYEYCEYKCQTIPKQRNIKQKFLYKDKEYDINVDFAGYDECRKTKDKGVCLAGLKDQVQSNIQWAKESIDARDAQEVKQDFGKDELRIDDFKL